MTRVTIALDEERLRDLRCLAARWDQSVAAVVRQAVDAYIVQHLADDPAWRARLEQLAAEARAQLPTGISPEEIEADITAASHEVRQMAMRRATRGR